MATGKGKISTYSKAVSTKPVQGANLPSTVTKRGPGNTPGWGKSTGRGGNSHTTSRVWINQLATHLPDQVVFVDHTKQMPFQGRFQGVLMFLDISGFTALCEKFSMNAKNGTDQLTKTLNGYMEALVSEILNSDGDVLKFAGDAILTVWKVSSFKVMRSTIQHVIQCAMNIQKNYGEWTTSVGVKLRVKIGIAAGEVCVTFLGNSEFCHYVTLGRAVDAVNMAEKFCKSGDVVISPSAWCHCSGMGVENEILSDNKHMKVSALEEVSEEANIASYNSMNIISLTDLHGDIQANSPGKSGSHKGPQQQVNIHTEGQDSKESLHTSQQRSSLGLDINSASHVDRSSHSQTNVKGRGSKKLAFNKSVAKRKTINIVFGNDVEINQQHFLKMKAIIQEQEDFVETQKKLYIAQPVLRKIEEQQPLEYLSEMRQVTIVFINLVIRECTNMEMALTLQQAFDNIYDNVKRSQGCLNKIFMFDKGSTFLVIFGLPGYKHESDCAHALKCSHRMKMELDKIKDIQCVSIGVTTGSSFCGVVGHAHRHEYTVIGRKVNMAARLMMYYPDKVTCDNETFHHSKLNKGSFHTLEIKEMKGLSNVGAIREYQPSANSQNTMEPVQQESVYPIIGRDAEMKTFIHEVRHIIQFLGSPEISQRQVIVFEGEPGIGKTKMLESVTVKASASSIKVISCALTMHDAKSPFYAMKSLLMDLLDFSFDQTHQERENALLRTFTDPFISDHVGLLNDILHVQFQVKEKIASANAKKRDELLHEVIFRIIQEINKQFGLIIFAIDDSHFMDSESWEFIRVLGKDNQSLVVMTLRTPFVMNKTVESLLNGDTAIRIQLQGLQPQYLAALACQLLGVSKIPIKLDNMLQNKSHGVPSWCEQLLREMMYEGFIRIESSVPEDLAYYEMVSPPSKYLYKQCGSTSGLDDDLYEFQHTDQPDESQVPENWPEAGLVCVLAAEKNLEIGLPDSIKGMIQARIDRMEELDQMIIKSAAILGMSFPRMLLETVLPRNTPKERISKSLQRLADCGIFVCAQPQVKKKNVSSGSANKEHLLNKTATCFCPLPDGTQAERPMEECQFICFFSASIQETTYEMFLENTRKKLHIKAAKFLESQAHKCAACGGGSFLQNLIVQPDDELSSASGDLGVTNPVINKAIRNVKPAMTSPGKELRHSTTSADSAPDDNLYDENCAILETMHCMTGDRRRANPRSSIASAIHRRLTRGTNIFAPQSAHLNTLQEAEIQKERRGTMAFNAQTSDDNVTEMTGTAERSSSVASPGSDMSGKRLSIVDKRECECLQILMSTYPQLVRHWKAAGNVGKTVHFLMESGAAAIATHDNMQALSYLNEVSGILDDILKGDNPFDGEGASQDVYSFNKWEQSRMESLIGQSLFHMGHIDESIPHFEKALSILDCEQPTTRFQCHMMLVKNAFQQWQHIKFPDLYLGKANLLFAHRLTEQARCLSHLLHWHLINNQDVRALNTALQQLNKAESADNDLHEVIMAYTCMMECCHALKWQRIAEMYVEKAQTRCMAAMDHVTPEDLVTITHFYVTSINMHLAWGKITTAIEAGYIAHGLTKKIHDNDMRIQMLPMFSQALIMANRVIDVVDILKQLQYTQEETKDHTAEAWYYGSCMDIILETGFKLEKYTKCTAFQTGCDWNPVINIVPAAQYYCNANMALWYMRKMEFDNMNTCMKLAEEATPSNYHEFMMVRGFVKLLEIQLIQLSRCLAKNNLKRVSLVVEQETHIKKDLKVLKNICSRMPVFKPRFNHLQAYLHAILGQNALAKKHLNKAITKAKEIDYTLEVEWVEHSRQVWYDPEFDRIQADFWLEHADVEMLDWHMASKVKGSRVKFSLPLPHWFQ